jgi:hypothetical protein
MSSSKQGVPSLPGGCVVWHGCRVCLGRCPARSQLRPPSQDPTSGSSSKTIVHPEVGPITLDCDVLTVASSDLRLVVYTAEPSSPDADLLRLVQVIGLQNLSVRNLPI